MTTQELTQTTVRSSNQARRGGLLRNTLRANAVFSEISGLVFLLFAGRLSALIGIQPPLVFTVMGAVVLGYGALLWLGTRQPEVSRTLAIFAIVADVLWVVDSAVVLLTGWLPLTTAGMWIVAILADIVLVFAILQFVGLRRAS